MTLNIAGIEDIAPLSLTPPLTPMRPPNASVRKPPQAPSSKMRNSLIVPRSTLTSTAHRKPPSPKDTLKPGKNRDNHRRSF
eukprot:CAMPEP_0202718822 /NCGR_PEP_ID=MMETSP1385-20130828/125805_1 /ASSEMBLY_ACC=CAM_ASM_000861 /TAXON_ID=933848 /ORGANISM="Elphidium margaritaceum" /LENGTH=80 /DNA_ID=CAMNT_0049381721 /DNA_START=49 /DNA_END=288 /DNA_ORIENTATION=+